MSLSDEDRSESEEDDESEESEESESDDESDDESACCSASFGAFRRCSRRPSVNPPSPIDVKKLIAKRVFFGLSRGKRPAKYGCMYGSLKRSLSLASPRNSAISCIRILMKIRLDEVVSCSFKRMN